MSNPRTPSPIEDALAAALTLNDTPAVAKKGSSPAVLFGDTEALRMGALEDSGTNVPEVAVDDFLESVLPPLPYKIGSRFEQILSDLAHGFKRDEVEFKPAYVSGRWVAFKSQPSKSNTNENIVFRALVEVADAIEAAASLHSTEFVCKFSNNPDSIPVSTWRNSPTRPDGHFVLRTPSLPQVTGAQKTRWLDIAATGEYKKRGTLSATNDDNLKAIWNMHHILRDDPRRRFTYAFTIEDTNMRLWYAGRSDIMVSASFDIMKDHKALVRFFLVFMFSDATSLGWDPTMKCVPDETSQYPQYDIEVHPKDGQPTVYRTIRLISDSHANTIRGRGTRVWEVVPVDDLEGERAVLKDAWIDSRRQREGDILAELDASATTARQKEMFKHCFLQVEVHGDVVMGGHVDSTICEETRALLLQEGRRFELDDKDSDGIQKRLQERSTEPGATGTHHSAQVFRDNLRGKYVTYRTKSRYRIVFKEVCVPLHQETDFILVLWALGQLCFALQFMHELGWVHRDISAGNVFIYKQGTTSARVILADLEYAKKMGSDGAALSDVRTGTADFMAVEVSKTSYVFGSFQDLQDQQVPPVEFDSNSYASTVRRSERTQVALVEPVPPQRLPPPFFYNPLHDMEAVWWLLLWFFINKDLWCAMPPGQTLPLILQEDDTSRTRRLSKLLEISNELFYFHDERWTAFLASNYQNYITYLHPGVRKVAQRVEAVRKALLARYHSVEAQNKPIDHHAADGLHGTISSLIWNVAADVRPAYDICVRVLKANHDPNRPAKTGEKRALDDDKDVHTEAADPRDSSVPGPSKKTKRLAAPAAPSDTQSEAAPASSGIGGDDVFLPGDVAQSVTHDA